VIYFMLQMSFRDQFTIDIFYTLLKKKLHEAMSKKALVDISHLRAIGKTTALIDFAKERRFIVVVPTRLEADRLKEYYNYEGIFGQGDVIAFRGTDIQCVVDEGVKVERLLMNKIDVVTGYTKLF
jgi:aconitase B